MLLVKIMGWVMVFTLITILALGIGGDELDYSRRVGRVYRGMYMSNVYCEQRNCKANHDGICQSEWAIVIKPDENGKPVCTDFEGKE